MKVEEDAMLVTVNGASMLGLRVQSKEAAMLVVMTTRTVRAHLSGHTDERLFVEPTKFYELGSRLYVMYPLAAQTADLASCITCGHLQTDPRLARHTAASICRALRSMHKHGVVHGNLTPRCVTLDEHSHVRVMFGGGVEAPAPYAAPEGARTAAADMWALGAIVREMCGPSGPCTLRDLASRLTETDPTLRGTAQAALAHRAFDGVTAEATLAHAVTAQAPIPCHASAPIPTAVPLTFH